MNANFINIKVDREERPDVDQIYINAVELMTGRAGWPLNVIALPDGRPVWGGTYFTKEDWIQRITRIQELYLEEPERLIEYADKLEVGIKSMDLVSFNDEDVDFSAYNSRTLVDKWRQGFDKRNGGYNRAPKFMMPNNYQFLLRHAVQQQDEELLDFVRLTLDKMAYGGIYDHIGGGFARYSTDERWHVPHFEKMLYDNAQMVSLYSESYSATKNPLYKQVVEETVNFVLQELTNKEGAFFSSLDRTLKSTLISTSSGNNRPPSLFTVVEVLIDGDEVTLASSLMVTPLAVSLWASPRRRLSRSSTILRISFPRTDRVT